MHEPMARPKRNLKSTLIEPFKQIKFGVYVIGLSLTFIVLTSALFIVAFTQQYQHVMSIFNITDMKTQMELVTNDIFYVNAARMAGLFLAFIGSMFWLVFKITHRYYGPLVSIERFVEQITRGDYSRRVTIRKNDELQRLVLKLNTMAEALQKRHAGTRPTSPAPADDEELS